MGDWGGASSGKRNRPTSIRSSSKEIQAVARALEEINLKVQEMEVASQKLGTAADTNSHRGVLKSLRTKIKELCAQASERIKMAQATGSNQAIMGKLKRDYASVMGRFTSLNDETLIKERRIVARLSADIKDRTSAGVLKTGDVGGTKTMQALEMQEDVDTQILRERQAELAAVEAEANEIRVLFNEVNEMVGEQGDMLNQVETDVENTGGKVSQGVTHLGDAYKYLQAYRRKKCFCWMLVILALTILGIIIWQATK